VAEFLRDCVAVITELIINSVYIKMALMLLQRDTPVLNELHTYSILLQHPLLYVVEQSIQA